MHFAQSRSRTALFPGEFLHSVVARSLLAQCHCHKKLLCTNDVKQLAFIISSDIIRIEEGERSE